MFKPTLHFFDRHCCLFQWYHWQCEAVCSLVLAAPHQNCRRIHSYGRMGITRHSSAQWPTHGEWGNIYYSFLTSSSIYFIYLSLSFSAPLSLCLMFLSSLRLLSTNPSCHPLPMLLIMFCCLSINIFIPLKQIDLLLLWKCGKCYANELIVMQVN